MVDARHVCSRMYTNIAYEIEKAKNKATTDSDEYYALNDILELIRSKKQQMINDCLEESDAQSDTNIR